MNPKAISPRDWSHSERLFQVNKYDGNPERILSVQNRRRSRVCLVAVHGVNHYSGADEAARKIADLYTGGLVRSLGFRTGATTICNRSRRPEINPYLGETAADREIQRLIKAGAIGIVMDIHGARDNDFFDIAIGTGGTPLTQPQRSLIGILSQCLSDDGLAVAVNPPMYRGMKPETIVQRHRNSDEVAVFQIEIIRRFRDPMSENGLHLFSALERLTCQLREIV